MPVRFKKMDEEGYDLEVKLPLPKSHWKFLCYLTDAGSLGMVDPWGPTGRYWVALVGNQGTSPTRTRRGAVMAWASFMETEIAKDLGFVASIQDAEEARVEKERLRLEDRQLIVEELRRHFPRANA